MDLIIKDIGAYVERERAASQKKIATITNLAFSCGFVFTGNFWSEYKNTKSACN